jgi:hypothetical protein
MLNLRGKGGLTSEPGRLPVGKIALQPNAEM